MANNSPSIEEILKRAVRFEEQAYDFYMGAVDMVKQPHIKKTLQELAGEEVNHKEKLEALIAGNTATLIAVQKRGEIQDLKLADYLIAPTHDENATLQYVLGAAMHREKSSHEFYSTMATVAGDESVKGLFEFLAEEELAHKNKIETLYDEVVYQDN